MKNEKIQNIVSITIFSIAVVFTAIFFGKIVLDIVNGKTETNSKNNISMSKIGVLEPAIKENATIDGKAPSYNNPVIPAGFFPVNTSDANWDNISEDWNKGLVIQDESGNQFVWVPIDGTNVKYEKNVSYPAVYSASLSNTLNDILPTDFDENKIKNKYQGFYIARYESMFDYNSRKL